jgi:hypothetical protein
LKTYDALVKTDKNQSEIIKIVTISGGMFPEKQSKAIFVLLFLQKNSHV